jgi:porin
MASSATGGKSAAARISRAMHVASLSAALVGWAFCAIAQDAPASATDQPPASPHAGGFWERDLLTGDWGGTRTDWENRGVRLGANYTGELLGNISGGVRRGAIYEGRLELLLNLDLEKAVGWSGATFHVNAYQIHGRGLSANDLGNNLLVVSNIEAERTTRLFDLWLQQELLDGLLSIRVGQLAADDEFIVSQYAANFVNATFGWPGITSANLPSGGPAYPLATPGVRIKLAPTSQLSVLAAVFNGDPAGPGLGTPQSRDASGTAFRVNDDAFAIAEAAYAINQGKDAKGLPGTYKVGGWYHSGRFADQRFDSAGRSLADPAGSGIPALHRGDYGLYAVMDQMVWLKPGTEDQGLGVFLRLGGSPSDRNQVDFYADGGINYKGLLPDRGSDVLGLGLAYARISDAARGLDRDTRFFSSSSRPIRDYEMALELTYQAKVTPWWTVQPDLQVIFHPGGHVPDPTDPSGLRPIRGAVVAGIRTTIAF